MPKQKFNFWPGVIALVILSGIVLFIGNYLKSQKSFYVNCSSAVESVVGNDNRAPVGSPAVCKVCISESLALKKSSEYTKWALNIAWVLLFVVVVYIFFASNEVFQGNNIHIFPILAASLALFLYGYSEAFSNNCVTILSELYEKIKDNPIELEKLFDKPLIR